MDENSTPERRRRAADLAALGYTQEEIARSLGISQPRVSQLLAEARQEWRQEQMSSYDHLVLSEHRYLVDLRRNLDAMVQSGSLDSIEAAIKLSERISRLLGLDHSDRMSERLVLVEEAKTRIMGRAVAAMLDELEIAGERREHALQVLQRELEEQEPVV